MNCLANLTLMYYAFPHHSCLSSCFSKQLYLILNLSTSTLEMYLFPWVLFIYEVHMLINFCMFFPCQSIFGYRELHLRTTNRKKIPSHTEAGDCVCFMKELNTGAKNRDNASSKAGTAPCLLTYSSFTPIPRPGSLKD